MHTGIFGEKKIPVYARREQIFERARQQGDEKR